MKLVVVIVRKESVSGTIQHSQNESIFINNYLKIKYTAFITFNWTPPCPQDKNLIKQHINNKALISVEHFTKVKLNMDNVDEDFLIQSLPLEGHH